MADLLCLSLRQIRMPRQRWSKMIRLHQLSLIPTGQKYNVKVDRPQYTDEQYETHLKSEDWSKEETRLSC